MMNRKAVLAACFGIALAANAGLAAKKSDKAKAKKEAHAVLSEGEYTAKVKALVCSGCGPMVESALKGMEGVESAAVDSGASTVKFSVKKGAKIRKDDLQKTLDAEAAKMGMGANFNLFDLKKSEKAG